MARQEIRKQLDTLQPAPRSDPQTRSGFHASFVGWPLKKKKRNSASTRGAAVLRMAALSLRHSQTALGAYRKLAQRLGSTRQDWGSTRWLMPISVAGDFQRRWKPIAGRRNWLWFIKTERRPVLGLGGSSLGQRRIGPSAWLVKATSSTTESRRGAS